MSNLASARDFSLHFIDGAMNGQLIRPPVLRSCRVVESRTSCRYPMLLEIGPVCESG